MLSVALDASKGLSVAEKSEAESALNGLEGTKQELARANFRLRNAEMVGDPALVEKYHAEHADAAKAHLDNPATPRQIDTAAQAVLNERGEGHTETNVLPSGAAQWSEEDRAAMLELDAAVRAAKPGSAEWNEARKNYQAVVGREWIEGGH